MKSYPELEAAIARNRESARNHRARAREHRAHRDRAHALGEVARAQRHDRAAIAQDAHAREAAAKATAQSNLLKRARLAPRHCPACAAERGVAIPAPGVCTHETPTTLAERDGGSPVPDGVTPARGS